MHLLGHWGRGAGHRPAAALVFRWRSGPHRLAAIGAEPRPGRQLRLAVGAARNEFGPAVEAELGAGRVLSLTVGAFHQCLLANVVTPVSLTCPARTARQTVGAFN